MPSTIDPLSIDFRAFHVLTRVHDLGSFTRAAEELGINQSAVSYTIEKLRGVFQDPLFVREGRRLQPTARCGDVVAMAKDVTDRYLTVAGPSEFDPATSTARFVIACNYYERVLLVPKLVHELRAKVPHLNLEIIDAADMGDDRLLRGEADLLIGPFTASGAAFYTRKLYDERAILVMDNSHPMAGKEITLDDYLALDHVLITYGGRWKSKYIVELERMGHQLNFALRMPSPGGLQSVLSGSQLVCTVPSLLARSVGDRLHVAPCPVPSDMVIQLVWTARTHQSPMNVFLRELVYRTIRQELGPSGP